MGILEEMCRFDVKLSKRMDFIQDSTASWLAIMLERSVLRREGASWGGLESPLLAGFFPWRFPDRLVEGVGGYWRRSGTVRVRFLPRHQPLREERRRVGCLATGQKMVSHEASHVG